MTSLLALALLPLSLAGLNSPPVDRHARHRDLSSRYRHAARSPLPSDYHPTLGKRSIEVRAGAGVKDGAFEVVGDSGVSAQMMFVGTAETVYILDSELQNPIYQWKGELTVC